MASKTPIAIPASSSSLHLAVGLIWLIGFSVWFHSFALPNNPVPRSLLWSMIPFDAIDVIDPPATAATATWSWSYLLQRVPFLSIAAGVWICAWGAGSLELRLLGIRLQGCEWAFFALCLGMSSVSLLMLLLGVCGCMSRYALLPLLTAPCLIEWIQYQRRQNGVVDSAKSTSVKSTSATFSRFVPKVSRFGWVCLIGSALFVAYELLGAMSPQTDFDVVEYHLGGPKEWFQAGRIFRLSHNVYTSFPFLSEMLTLTGMVIYGDWEWGALAGQTIIAGFAPITAVGLYAAGRRWFSESCGYLAALVYLTSPWTYRISIIAYAEGGISCYLYASIFAVLLFRDRQQGAFVPNATREISLVALTGMLAGSAMACKYPGLVSVVIPIGGLLLWIAADGKTSGRWKALCVTALIYVAGMLATIGPWLVKNAVETRNPVYPLAVKIFGGTDRDQATDAKWVRAHAAKTYASWGERLNDLPVKLVDVAARNDWHSPLMFGLAPLSLFWLLRRHDRGAANPRLATQQAIIGIVILYSSWQFLTWWILTHHIDRFYVPMFSVVALLAGIGACWPDSEAFSSSPIGRSPIWNWVAGGVIAASVLYNADVMLHIGGFNAGRLDLNEARRIAVAPRIAWLNLEYEEDHLGAKPKVLCVGEALMFHARYPYLYNTVFDHSLLEKLCADPQSKNHGLRPAAAILTDFRQLGITHVDVNWAEILRYREAGNYGYTDFVSPERFAELQRIGVLASPLNLPAVTVLSSLTGDLRSRLQQWGPSLLTSLSGEPVYISAQLFPVNYVVREP